MVLFLKFHFLIKDNSNSKHLICSYRYQNFGKCDTQFEIEQNKSLLYVDSFFDRVTFDLNEMSKYEFDQAMQVIHTGFYFKSVYLTYKSSLIDVQLLYTGSETSFSYIVPAVKVNFTQATYQTCRGQGFIEPFDPRCRGWYLSAKSNKGIYFQQPYVDVVTGNVLMSSSKEILLGDGVSSIVFGIDFGITNIIQKIFQPQDLVIEEGYTVLFHLNNHTVFHHKNYDAKSGLLLSWEDVEYNATKGDIFSQYQKGNFTEQLNKSIQFMENGNYDIQNQQNIDGFYQKWEKNNKKYLFYPISISISESTQNPQNQLKFNILMVGRVNKDITDIIGLVNVNQNPFFLLSILIETVLMVIIIIIFVLHYGAVQYYQVEIPIIMLTQFLKQNYHQQGQNTTQVKQIESKSCTTASNLKKSKFFVDSGTGKRIEDFINNKQIKDNEYENEIQDFLNKSPRSRTDSNLKNEQQKNESISRDRSLSKRLLYKQNKESQKHKLESFQFIGSQYDIQQNLDEQFKKSEMNQKHQQQQISEDEDNKILLKDIEPMFLEMQIILDTFQKLESVIQYAISESNKGSMVNSLLHFSNAKKTFSIIQNYIGLGMCYFNIALLHLTFDRYEESIENLLASIDCSLQELNLTSLEELIDRLQKGCLKNDILTLRILSKRLLGLAMIFKEKFKEQNNYNCYLPLRGDRNGLYESIKYLQICLIIVNITYDFQQNKKQKQAIYIEMAESYLLLDDCDSCVYYLNIVEQSQQDCMKQSFNLLPYYQLDQTRERTLTKNSNNQPNYKRKKSNEESNNQNLDESCQLNQSNISFFSSHNYLNQKNVNHDGSQKVNFTQSILNSNYDKQINRKYPDCVSGVNFSILQSKMQFIQGILSCREQYFYLGSQLLTQSIENSKIYDPSIRYQALISLQTVLQFNFIDFSFLSEDINLLIPTSQPKNRIKKQKQDNLFQNSKSQHAQQEDQQMNTEDCEENFDFVIVLQNTFTLMNEFINTQINVLKFLNQKFLNLKKDRISIITYNSIIKIVQPLVIIQSKKQLNFCINQFKNEFEQLIYQNYSGINQSNSIYQHVNPKIAFIASLNFFRSERTKKFLTASIQQLRKQQFEEFFNHPLFLKYIELLIRPLLNEFQLKYDKASKFDVEIESYIKDYQTVFSFLNSNSNLKRNSTKLFSPYQQDSVLQNPSPQIQSEQNLFSFIEKQQPIKHNQEYLDSSQKHDQIQNLFTNDQQFDTFKQLIETNRMAKFDEKINQKVQEDQIHTQKSIFQDKLNNQLNNPHSKNLECQIRDMKQIDRRNGEVICQEEHQISNQKKKADQLIETLCQCKSEETFELQSSREMKPNLKSQSSQPLKDKYFLASDFLKQFETSLFNSIKVERQSNLNKKTQEKRRKQIMIFFSFTNVDSDEELRNQIFAKVSYIDEIEILHYTIKKPQTNQNNNKSLGASIQNQNLQEQTNQNINKNYFTFYDTQQLIHHLSKMRSSTFYKYSMLSQYLNTNF